MSFIRASAQFMEKILAIYNNFDVTMHAVTREEVSVHDHTCLFNYLDVHDSSW